MKKEHSTQTSYGWLRGTQIPQQTLKVYAVAGKLGVLFLHRFCGVCRTRSSLHHYLLLVAAEESESEVQIW